MELFLWNIRELLSVMGAPAQRRRQHVVNCKARDAPPEGYEGFTLLTYEVAKAHFLRWFYSHQPDPLAVSYYHLSKRERNAEIVRRHASGESLTVLAKEFELTVQRAWNIVERCSQRAKGPPTRPLCKPLYVTCYMQKTQIHSSRVRSMSGSGCIPIQPLLHEVSQ